MKRFAMFFHVTVVVLSAVVLAVCWTLLVTHGQRGYFRMGPVWWSFTWLIPATFVILPALLFSGWRVVQLFRQSRGSLGGWRALRGLSNVFALLTIAMLGGAASNEDWEEYRAFDWQKGAAELWAKEEAPSETKNPKLTDGRLDYPNLPLQTPDNYAWSAVDLDGNEVAMADFKGKTLFLNFWATWCGPCRDEMPSVQRLYDEMKTKGVEFALMTREKPDEIRAFLDENGYTIPVYLYEDTPPKPLQSNGIPATFILAPNGNLAYQHVGSAAWDTPKTTDFLRALSALQDGEGLVAKLAGK